MGLNCYFYYSGIMTLPINVNENSLIMLNYQYIFYGIGSYATLNLRNIVEEKSEKRTKICLVMLFLFIIINLIIFIVIYVNWNLYFCNKFIYISSFMNINFVYFYGVRYNFISLFFYIFKHLINIMYIIFVFSFIC